jgi:hypothetical protein
LYIYLKKGSHHQVAFQNLTLTTTFFSQLSKDDEF